MDDKNKIQKMIPKLERSLEPPMPGVNDYTNWEDLHIGMKMRYIQQPMVSA